MLYLLMLRRGEGTVEVWGEIVWKLNFQPCTEGKIDDTGLFRHTWENAVTPIHDLESNCEAPILGEIFLGHMYCINVQNSFRAVSDRDFPINFKKFIQIRINSWRFQEILWNPCVYFGFLSLPIDSSAEDYQRLRARGFWGISKDSYNFSEEIIRVPNDSKICRGNFPKRSQEEIFISDFRGHSHFSTILKFILKDSL